MESFKALFQRLSTFLGLSLLCIPTLTSASYGDTSTWLGQAVYGNGKSAHAAYFDFPYDFERTRAGGWVIADTSNQMIRRITAAGTVKLIAGTGSTGDVIGAASAAEFNFPRGIGLVGDGRIVVADTFNNAIKLISNGTVKRLTTTVRTPEDVLVHDGLIYIADTGNHALKRISVDGGVVTTLTIDLKKPTRLSINNAGTIVYIMDEGSYQIRQWDIANRSLRTLAGSGTSGQRDGLCNQARFQYPASVVQETSTSLLVSDRSGSADYVKRITLSPRCTVETVFTDLSGFTVNAPRLLAMADHQLYMLLAGYGFIDRFSLPDITVLDRFAGADRYQVKSSQPALTGRPQYLVLSPDHRWIYIAENNRLSRVRRSHPKTIEVIAGSVVDDYPTDELKNKIGSRARFTDIPSFALSPDGTTAYVVDRNDNRIRRVDIKTGTVSYITGAGRVKDGATPNGLQDGEACPNTFEAGVANCAYFHGPMGSALSSTGRYLYVTDSGNNAIRRVTVTGPHTGRVITLAGTTTAGYVNAVGKKARFHAPIGLTINKAGTLLYIADRNNFVIRKLNIKTRAVTTLAGAGRNGYREGSFHDAVFSYPDTVTRHGRSLYVAEVGSHMIRKLDLETKMTSLVAGSTRGFANGSATQARFHNPRSPLIWKNTMWIADTFNDQIRKIRLK